MRCESGIEDLCLDAMDGTWWGVPLQLCLLLYCFIGLARVADAYLITSLETLCVRMNVREDVAGASFMAFGSAAPEIIVNAVTTLKDMYESNASGENASLGIGAIIGSGMIAFTLIPGACALASRHPLHLKRRPLLRDLVFYSLALLLLMTSIEDGSISWWEGISMLLLYVLYMVVVVASGMVRSLYRVRVLGLPPKQQRSFVQGVVSSTSPLEPAMDGTPLGDVAYDQPTLRASIASGADWVSGEVRRGTWDALPAQLGPVASSGADADMDNDEDDRGWTVAMPLELDLQRLVPARMGECQARSDMRHHVVTHGLRFIETISIPLDVAFSYTCPECAHDGPQARWYPLTFVVSFLWISTFSLVISAVVGHWGKLSGVPASFLGLAIIAIGAEVPDTIQSVTVARRGYGSMAVSNSFGSQIINILIGLGVPWSISAAAGKTVHVGDVSNIRVMGGLLGLNVLAIATVLLGVALTCNQNKAVLSRAKGALLLIMYLLSVATYAVYLLNNTTESAGSSPNVHVNGTNSTAAPADVPRS